jgi:hypothetical protein
MGDCCEGQQEMPAAPLSVTILLIRPVYAGVETIVHKFDD